MQADERFEGTLELEWPIEGQEPLSFVLTRLLEPLSTRLERRDRGVAVLHVELHLVTREVHTCRLELPSPLRDVRALRTLALLNVETHCVGAERNHWNMRRRRVCAQDFQDLDSADIGQINVHENYVW